MLFLDIDFFLFLHRFGEVLGLQVGGKMVVLGSQGAPKSLQNPIFWGHVSKMLVKRLQTCPQGAPDVEFWMIFEGFGTVFSRFSPVKINSLDQNSRCHVYLKSDAITHKYILTDKPHVQLEFKLKICSILHGADACPSKQ